MDLNNPYMLLTSGKMKITVIGLMNAFEDLVAKSNLNPVPFSKVKYDPNQTDISSRTETELWYDDQDLRLDDPEEHLRKYSIIAETQLDELHHDIISFVDDWSPRNPLCGLTVNLVFDDSEEAKENGDDWYIEVVPNDAPDLESYIIIEHGDFYFV